MYQGSVGTASNREDLELLYDAIDEDTKDAIDLTTSSIVFRISELDGCHRINASTADGKITLVEPSVFRIFIPETEMNCLRSGTYEVGVTISNADITKSLIVGSITILDGVVGR